MRLRKRQGWTVVYQQPVGASPHGRVVITNSETGLVRELAPGEATFVDASLELTPLELGWEVVP